MQHQNTLFIEESSLTVHGIPLSSPGPTASCAIDKLSFVFYTYHVIFPPLPSQLLHHQYANLLGDPYRRIQEALEVDPSCVMAHCLKGMLAALSHADPVAVDVSLADAERGLMAYGEGEEGRRERVFASALRAWSAGRWREVNV